MSINADLDSDLNDASHNESRFGSRKTTSTHFVTQDEKIKVNKPKEKFESTSAAIESVISLYNATNSPKPE